MTLTYHQTQILERVEKVLGVLQHAGRDTVTARLPEQDEHTERIYVVLEQLCDPVQHELDAAALPHRGVSEYLTVLQSSISMACDLVKADSEEATEELHSMLKYARIIVTDRSFAPVFDTEIGKHDEYEQALTTLLTWANATGELTTLLTTLHTQLHQFFPKTHDAGSREFTKRIIYGQRWLQTVTLCAVYDAAEAIAISTAPWQWQEPLFVAEFYKQLHDTQFLKEMMPISQHQVEAEQAVEAEIQARKKRNLELLDLDLPLGTMYAHENDLT